jgi:hypothetical protein
MVTGIISSLWKAVAAISIAPVKAQIEHNELESLEQEATPAILVQPIVRRARYYTIAHKLKMVLIAKKSLRHDLEYLINIDETPVQFGISSDYTLDRAGAKEVLIRKDSSEKSCVDYHYTSKA